jgi:hypothetical protein
MQRTSSAGLVETDRQAQLRNALLTIAFGVPLLWAFLQTLNFYPVTFWGFAAEPRELGSGPVRYFVLAGETRDGRIVEVPSSAITNALGDRNATLARAIQLNTQFLIRSPHPRNAQLWARWRMLPPDASLGELLAGWGNAYNLRRGENVPDPLVAVRLDEFEWPYVHLGDFEQHKASWRVQLTP